MTCSNAYDFDLQFNFGWYSTTIQRRKEMTRAHDYFDRKQQLFFLYSQRQYKTQVNCMDVYEEVEVVVARTLQVYTVDRREMNFFNARAHLECRNHYSHFFTCRFSESHLCSGCCKQLVPLSQNNIHFYTPKTWCFLL